MENALPPRAEFEKFSGKKPFLGGFRHKKTGVLYHHASSQTEMSEAKKAALLKKVGERRQPFLLNVQLYFNPPPPLQESYHISVQTPWQVLINKSE